MTVLVKRVGCSLAVVIPQAVAVESQLAARMQLDVSTTLAGILVRRSGRRPWRSIADIAWEINPAANRRHTSYLGPLRSGEL